MNTTITTSNIVTNQSVLATLRKAGVSMGRNLTSTRGWVVEAVDNNNTRALTVNGRVYTPATAVRLSYNAGMYKHQEERRDAQLPTVIEALTAKGLKVVQVRNIHEWLITAN